MAAILYVNVIFPKSRFVNSLRDEYDPPQRFFAQHHLIGLNLHELHRPRKVSSLLIRFISYYFESDVSVVKQDYIVLIILYQIYPKEFSFCD